MLETARRLFTGIDSIPRIGDLFKRIKDQKFRLDDRINADRRYGNNTGTGQQWSRHARPMDQSAR